MSKNKSYIKLGIVRRKETMKENKRKKKNTKPQTRFYKNADDLTNNNK